MLKTGLILAYVLDGKGGGRKIGWEEINQWKSADGILWVHLDYSQEDSRQWGTPHSGVSELVMETLLAEETRPRTVAFQNGLLICLRGVNNNPGAEPEDMVSIRIWIDPIRIITSRKRRLLSIQDLSESLDRGDGPRTPGEFLFFISDRLVDRMHQVVEEIEERVDQLEETILISESHKLRSQLADIRRETILL